MNKLLLYYGLVDVRINTSDKDLPVLLEHFFLTEGQNNFGNKIPFLFESYKTKLHLEQLSIECCLTEKKISEECKKP